MNCVRCPIIEECPASKEVEESKHSSGIALPVKIAPYNPGECLFLQTVAKVEMLKGAVEGLASGDFRR